MNYAVELAILSLSVPQLTQSMGSSFWGSSDRRQTGMDGYVPSPDLGFYEDLLLSLLFLQSLGITEGFM